MFLLEREEASSNQHRAPPSCTQTVLIWVKWKVVVFWGLSIDDSGEDEDEDPPHPDYSGGVRGGVW